MQYPEKSFPQRKSPRAAWHDYNAGIYFVTICTKNKAHYFGEIIETPNAIEPQMQLSEIGKVAEENLQNISAHYPYAEIPLFVVMPNHIHAIVIIDSREEDNIDGENVANIDCTDRALINGTDKACLVRTDEECPNCTDKACLVRTDDALINCTDRARPVRTEEESRPAPVVGKLSVVVGGFKSAVTKYANQNAIPFAWLPRFNDRIVRNQKELNSIAQYIENNVIKWHLDEYK